MATVVIQKRERKEKNSYLIHYKDPVSFKTYYYKSFRKYKEAQKAAQNLRALIDNNQFVEIERNRKKIQPMTFEEVANLQAGVWERRFNQNDLSKETFEGYKVRIKVLNRDFGNNLMCEITKQTVIRT